MDAENKVTQRLLKKLTALRMTLAGDERDLLDKLVVSEESNEVTTHSMSTGKLQPKMQPKMQPKYDPKLKPGEDEVVHGRGGDGAGADGRREDDAPGADESGDSGVGAADDGFQGL